MNILITSVGRRTYMVDYFKSAVGENGRVYAANSELTYAMKKADGCFITPYIYDINYIKSLIEYCLEKKINAIISLFDIDLPILSKNKKIFNDNNITLLISDYQFTKLCNDKWATYHFLKENKFMTPVSFISLDKCKISVIEKEIDYPIIIKPRWGMGSIGVYEADNEQELDIFYKKTKQSILRSYLKFESNSNIDSSVILQEKINGIEHGIDVLNDLNGNYIGCVPKVKIAMRAGETDIAKTIHNKKLINLAKDLASKTRHSLNLDVDCFINENEIFILEMNPRFGGQYPFSHASGVNYPKVIIDLLAGNNIDKEDIRFKSTKSYKDFEIKKHE